VILLASCRHFFLILNTICPNLLGLVHKKTEFLADSSNLSATFQRKQSNNYYIHTARIKSLSFSLQTVLIFGISWRVDFFHCSASSSESIPIHFIIQKRNSFKLTSPFLFRSISSALFQNRRPQNSQVRKFTGVHLVTRPIN
jgi:hypothetical protein